MMNIVYFRVLVLKYFSLYSDMTCRRFKFGCDQIFGTLWPLSVHCEHGFSRLLRNTEANSTFTWPPHNRINSRFMGI